MILEFGEFLPDQAALNGGVQKAENVVPNARGYSSLKSLSAVSDALPKAAVGAVSYKAIDGTVYSYVGTSSKLYELNSGVHIDVTNTGGDYTLGTDEFWNFVKWGDTIVALTKSENPQVLNFAGANFSDLAGSPPKAKFGTVISNFMVLANINDGTEKSTTVRWSAINDNTNWTIDPDTQADEQTLFSDADFGSGVIKGITGGEYGNVFFEHTIWRMTYVGSPLVFQFDEVVPSIGCAYARSLTQEGRLVHFIGEDGFYQLIDGSQIKKIGKNKVDQYFLNRVDEAFDYKVVGASDPKNSLVFWTYVSTSSSNGQADSIIIYDWLNDKWSTADLSIDLIYAAPREGYTLEQLDSFSASIDTLKPSLDSDAWKSRSLSLSVYGTDFKKSVFTGVALEATVDTAEYQVAEGARAHITGVRPLFDGSASGVTVALGQRDTQQDVVDYTSFKSTNSRTGLCNFRSDARYHRARVHTDGATDYNYMLGVDVEAELSGKV